MVEGRVEELWGLHPQRATYPHSKHKPGPGRRKTGIHAAQVMGGRLERAEVEMWPQGGDCCMDIVLGGVSGMERSPSAGAHQSWGCKLLEKDLGYSQSFHLFDFLS